MKTRFLKSILVLLVVCTLALSLTGCDDIDYKKAVRTYNNREYAQAAQMFTLLGDYENSAQMVTQCHYWLAVEDMEAGRYEEAVQGFSALGGHGDFESRITECVYQLAIQAFDAGDLASAEAMFLEAPDYRQSPEYLRRINWQKLYDQLAQSGTISTTTDSREFTISAQEGSLLFQTAWSKDMGYLFSDSLVLTLTQESTLADFLAEDTFTMDFNGSEIGSQQTAAGKIDITTCTPETVLNPDRFEKTVTDNLGNTTTSTDLAENQMAEDMAEHFAQLMTLVPQMLQDAGITLTLADIGFAAM